MGSSYRVLILDNANIKGLMYWFELTLSHRFWINQYIDDYYNNIRKRNPMKIVKHWIAIYKYSQKENFQKRFLFGMIFNSNVVDNLALYERTM